MQKIGGHIQDVVGAEGAGADPELMSTWFAGMLASQLPQPSDEAYVNDPDMALAHALFVAVNGRPRTPQRAMTPPGQKPFFPGADLALPPSRSGRRPSPLALNSPTSTIAAATTTATANEVTPLFDARTSQGRSKDLNSMAAMLMAAATGQTVDQLQMQEFDYDDEQDHVQEQQQQQQLAASEAEQVTSQEVENSTPREQVKKEEETRVGTPVPRDVRREIRGGPLRKRTSRQLAQAVAANAQKLTSHAMHLSRELKVRLMSADLFLNYVPPTALDGDRCADFFHLHASLGQSLSLHLRCPLSQAVQSDVDYMLRSTQTVLDAILSRRFVPPSLDPTKYRQQRAGAAGAGLPGTPTRPAPPKSDLGSGASWPALDPSQDPNTLLTPRSASK